MKKEYLTPEIESYQLNLSVGIMSDPSTDPGFNQDDYNKPGRHDGPAGL